MPFVASSKITFDTLLQMLLHRIFFNAEQLHSAGGSVASHERYYVSLGAPISSLVTFTSEKQANTEEGRLNLRIIDLMTRVEFEFLGC